MLLMILFLGVGIAWWLQKNIYRRLWRRKLEISVSFAQKYAFEGETSALQEVIVNGKLLPLPALEVRLSMDRSLEFTGGAKDNSSISDLSYKRDIFSLFVRQRIVRTLPFVCRKRGFYCIQRADMIGYDFFFNEASYLEAEQDTQFFVYPRPVDTARIRPICRAVSGMVLSKNRLYPDPFEFSGIREYLPTDSMHLINWKASAKSGSLMVNQYDSTTSIHLTILLDVADEGIWKYEALTEEGIRIAASLAARLAAQNMELDIISNGVCSYPGEEERLECLAMHLKAGGGQMPELNRRLACMDTAGKTQPMAEVLAAETAKHMREHIYLLISQNQDGELLHRLRALAGGDNQVLWIVPLHPAMELTLQQTAGIQIMRWEVAS